MLDIPKWVKGDRNWRSALYVLDSSLLASKNCRQYVDFEQREIDIPQLLTDAEAVWSHGEKLLAQLTADLFNGSGHVCLADIIRVLDDDNWQIAMDAMMLFRA